MKINHFKLERFFDKYEFKVRYSLCSSDCESMSVETLLSLEPGAEEQLKKLWLGYTEYPGHPSLRAAIAALYERIEPDQVIVHTGAEEAIFNFMSSVVQAGDHVIVHYPCYQSLTEVALANDCEVTRWATGAEADWELDLDFLRQNIKPNTRAIVVNCPHNPTGYQMDSKKQRELIDLAREHNLLLFSDEVYRGLEYADQDRLPAACDLYENAISLGVMSKTYGLPGLRIGWVASRNQSVMTTMLAFKDYLSMCNSAPGEVLATIALRHHAKLAGRNRGLVLNNLALLDAFFARHPATFDWWRPKAGPIAFPALKTGQPVEEFCRQLVEETGILLAPGALFNHDGPHFRIGFGRQNLPEVLEKFEEYLIERRL